jgi:hypothetical protein
MDRLNTFYDKIENPIDNKSKWNKMLSIYSSSYDFNDFYEKMTWVNQSINPYYIKEDKEKFSLIMWSLWKSKIQGFSEEKVYEYITKGVFDSDIYDCIKAVNNLDSVKEYTKLKEVLLDDNIRTYYGKFFDEELGNNVVTSNFDIVNDYTYNTVFTVTVGGINLYKFLIDYVNYCLSKELDFYIKFNEFGKYINVNIFASIVDVREIENAISIVMKENYAFHYDNIYNILSGDIDDYLSIRNRTYFNQNDYNNSRCLILFKSLDGVMYNYVLNHLNVMVSYKDGRMNVLDYISNNVTDRILHELINKQIKTEAEYYTLANSSNLTNLRSFIHEKISQNIIDILNKNLYLKENDYKVSVTLNEGKTFDIDAGIFMFAIRTLTSALILKDNSIERLFKVRIKNECLYQKIDPDKFCLDKLFTDKLLYNEGAMKAYEDELSSIKTEINRLSELEGMFNGTATSEERQKIAANMKELLEHFSE